MTDDYKKKPRPNGVRFGEGQRRSRGRPKRALNLKTIAAAIAGESHTVVIDGKSKRLTTADLLFHIVVAKAVNGHIAAAKLLDQFEHRFRPESSENYGVLLVPETATPQQWFEMAARRNATAENPEERYERELAEGRKN